MEKINYLFIFCCILTVVCITTTISYFHAIHRVKKTVNLKIELREEANKQIPYYNFLSISAFSAGASILSIALIYWQPKELLILASIFISLAIILFSLNVIYPDQFVNSITKQINHKGKKLTHDIQSNRLKTTLLKQKLARKIIDAYERQIEQIYHDLEEVNSTEEFSFKIKKIPDAFKVDSPFLDTYMHKKFLIKSFITFMIFLSTLYGFLTISLGIDLQIIHESAHISLYDTLIYFLSLSQNGIDPESSVTKDILLVFWGAIIFCFTLIIGNIDDHFKNRHQKFKQELSHYYSFHYQIILELEFDSRNNLLRLKKKYWKAQLEFMPEIADKLYCKLSKLNQL